MSFSEHTKQLEQSFRNTAELQRILLQTLQGRRAAWSSIRPSLVTPSPELEQIAKELAREEAVRSHLTASIAAVLPAPIGGTATDLHINVTRIAAAMPPAEARALRLAADIATASAKAVRTEVTLGQRLLRFSQRVQQGLVGRAGGATRAAGATAYDRHARRSGLTVRGSEGSLVDGRI